MDDKENVAEVSFWVDSNGNLLGEPTVTKPAADPALGQSGINAIKLAAPFPPLPEGYPHPEQMIVYGFTLTQ
jgi:TonB family protein